MKNVHWLVDNPVRKLTGEPAWFLRSDAGTTDIWIQGKKKHEILRDVDPWENHNLTWEKQEAPISAESNVIHVPRPSLKKGWKPRIIDGGKV